MSRTSQQGTQVHWRIIDNLVASLCSDTSRACIGAQRSQSLGRIRSSQRPLSGFRLSVAHSCAPGYVLLTVPYLLVWRCWARMASWWMAQPSGAPAIRASLFHPLLPLNASVGTVESIANTAERIATHLHSFWWDSLAPHWTHAILAAVARSYLAKERERLESEDKQKAPGATESGTSLFLLFANCGLAGCSETKGQRLEGPGFGCEHCVDVPVWYVRHQSTLCTSCFTPQVG